MLLALKRINESIQGFLVKIIQTSGSVIKIAIQSRPMRPMPDGKLGEIAILGNGPSLRASLDSHPEFFRERELLAVNNFALAADYTQLKPGYYFMLDPGYWTTGETPNPFATQTLSTLKEKTDWPMHIFLPRQAKRSKTILGLKENPNIRLVFFNYTILKGFKWFRYAAYALGLGCPPCQNVLVGCIFLALRCRFQKIYLFGADHNWHKSLMVNENNELCLMDAHFYSDKQQISYRKFYKVGGKELFTVKEIFLTWARVFEGYEHLRDYARYKKAEIINLTPDSFIDVFKRGTL